MSERGEWDEMHRRVGAILKEHWDRLGVPARADDGYGTYVEGIRALLLKHASDEVIARHLQGIEVGAMGINGTPFERLLRVANELRRLEPGPLLREVADSAVSAQFLLAAIEEAERGRREGGIPIGSVLVHNGQIIGRGHNRRVQRGSAILHGEMDALENAGRQSAVVYRESVLYTTLSPCSMCSGTILLYGIPEVVIGENQTFRGEEDWLRSRGVSLRIVQDSTCIRMMADFIEENPQLWHEDIGRTG
jgi:cytosine deaminase